MLTSSNHEFGCLFFFSLFFFAAIRLIFISANVPKFPPLYIWHIIKGMPYAPENTQSQYTSLAILRNRRLSHNEAEIEFY